VSYSGAFSDCAEVQALGPQKPSSRETSIAALSACPQDIVGFQPGGPTDMSIEILR
jgi:hypothetical protein